MYKDSALRLQRLEEPGWYMIGKVKAQTKIGGANKKVMIKAGASAFVLLSAWMEENFNKKEYE